MSEAEIPEANVSTPGDLKKMEDAPYADAMAQALKEFERRLQLAADALGATGRSRRRRRSAAPGAAP